MSASTDELLTLLNAWKKDENKLQIVFSQPGQTRLSTSAVVSDVSDKEVTFSFGLQIAGGTLVISLASELLVGKIIDPSDPPFSPENWDPAFECCIDFTWNLLSDRCIVQAFPKTH